MSGPAIVVCAKVVPRPEEVKVDGATRTIDRAHARSMMNPPDMNALEIALRLKGTWGGTVTALTMGPKFFEAYLRLVLMMGADRGVLLCDRAFAGADTLATTYVLARGIAKLAGADLVLCGEESSDGATGQVPQGIAEWLGYAQVTNATDVAFSDDGKAVLVRRELSGGWERVRATLPAVVAVRSGVNEPRFLNYARREWSQDPDAVAVWTGQDLAVEPERVGIAGSPTAAVQLRELPRRERRREVLTGAPDEMARRLVERLRPYLG